MVLGVELIADVDDIKNSTLLETIDGIKPLMEKINKECKLNVVNSCEYEVNPIGATMLYLLAESHLTIHTYPEKQACSINLYSCNANIDFMEALNVIYEYFDKPFISKRIFYRL